MHLCVHLVCLYVCMSVCLCVCVSVCLCVCACAGIRRVMQARGVEDSQIIFTEIAGKQEHIKRGALADLFVDTLQAFYTRHIL